MFKSSNIVSYQGIENSNIIYTKSLFFSQKIYEKLMPSKGITIKSLKIGTAK